MNDLLKSFLPVHLSVFQVLGTRAGQRVPEWIAIAWGWLKGWT